jgi:hypothetical protein
MNANFSDDIKKIIAAQNGDAKNALTKAIKMHFVEELKTANEKKILNGLENMPT